MDRAWLLLIYTVPAEPSRKRAFVWREVKKLGAIYLRDGVCVLPQRPDTLAAATGLAGKIDEFEGQATLATDSHFEPSAAERLVGRFRSARAEEYREIAQSAEQLLAHVARETEHRDFSFRELEELEQDLAKLKRWAEQVRSRDYFSETTDALLESLFERCAHALAEFTATAAAEDTV